MTKLFIKNRKGQNISVLVDETKEQKGLAFLMHGLGSSKERPHMKVLTEAFNENGLSVVRFDTTNTIGESDGNYEDATVTNYFEDLEDVISWSKTQTWYKEPFYLLGHSLGGICTTLYAERHIGEVKGLAPISTVVSGKLSEEAAMELNPEDYKKWKESGWRISESSSQPGTFKKLRWSHMEDRLGYDLIPGANTLIMPVLLITGSEDTSTPPKHVEILFNAIPHSNKSHHIIQGAPHSFKNPEYLAEIKLIVKNWIQSVENSN